MFSHFNPKLFCWLYFLLFPRMTFCFKKSWFPYPLIVTPLAFCLWILPISKVLVQFLLLPEEISGITIISPSLNANWAGTNYLTSIIHLAQIVLWLLFYFGLWLHCCLSFQVFALSSGIFLSWNSFSPFPCFSLAHKAEYMLKSLCYILFDAL